MNERLVISVLVKRIELQIAVQKECVARLAFRYDNALVRRALSVNDVVDKQGVLGQCRQPIGLDKGDDKQDEDHKSLDPHNRDVFLYQR